MDNNRINRLIVEEIRIVEGYVEVNEIMLLADDVLSTYGNRCSEKIYEGIEGGLNLKQVFENGDMFDNFSILEVEIRRSYSIIGEFIKKFYFSFSFNRLGKGVRGKYDEEDKVAMINIYFQRYYDELNSSDIMSEDEYDEKVVMNKIVESSKKCGIKSALVHEIQHAYDDYRSGGKYSINKRTERYINKYGSGNYDDTSDERMKAYLNLPQEYWARLSQFISNNDIKSYGDFNLLWNKFRDEFEGFEHLSNDDIKRLSKSLYKYWSENK